MNRNLANRTIPVRLATLLLAGVVLTTPVAFSPALALSELQGAPQPVPGEQPATGDQKATPPVAEPVAEEPDEEEKLPLEIPRPDPLINKSATTTKDEAPAAEEPETVGPVEVLTDVSKIPAPVARMRELIVEAAASGDIERLRPLLGKGPTQTQVTGVTGDEDPVAILKGLSGDQEGVEILAILLDVLSTGFVLVDKGTPQEAYVWPYFAEKKLSTLTAPEKVDLFRLVTAGDFADMEEFGSYNFYRVGIMPDGKWKFFIAGD
ncbi:MULTISPECIES: hypothetical protein [unclassified Ensifer]|uniref:hypothetical protein n=1 Tax=unclassified Ensifer TaxID=2633371 RepID=UPI000813564A|nr:MULTISPECIES: hypothetical protein [unclassified Ensifer]OCO98163.1 hypothetical protein BC362_03540 [Ensifer sp. LC14]OCP03805.1 hypothetical protein BBX50_26525 [Ensifer sp. LC11]OCP04221.1 hypothetical protein BC374_26680 [Ensifer sp. LC13]OCP30335.1 hypothetical protein BC364_26545 [Ensifer sp. LC499]